MQLALQAFAAEGPTPARRFELRVASGGKAAHLRFEGGAHGLRFATDGAPAELVIEAGPADLIGLLTGLLPAAAARARGVRLEGDVSALADLRLLFRFDVSKRAQPGANP